MRGGHILIILFTENNTQKSGKHDGNLYLYKKYNYSYIL